MNPANSLSLFIAMVVLAATPSMSVLTVTARAAASGFAHGAATSLGIVAGDIVYILIAIFGLGMLVEHAGGVFDILRVIGGLYLCWLALGLWRSNASGFVAAGGADGPLASSFLAGLMLTLADHKAILFYLVFFPAFVDPSRLRPQDIAVIVAVTIIAVGGVKLAYAFAADRASLPTDTGTRRYINRLAGLVVAAAGMVLLFGG